MLRLLTNIFSKTQPIYDPCWASCHCIDYDSYGLVSGNSGGGAVRESLIFSQLQTIMGVLEGILRRMEEKASSLLRQAGFLFCVLFCLLGMTQSEADPLNTFILYHSLTKPLYSSHLVTPHFLPPMQKPPYQRGIPHMDHVLCDVCHAWRRSDRAEL